MDLEFVISKRNYVLRHASLPNGTRTLNVSFNFVVKYFFSNKKQFPSNSFKVFIYIFLEKNAFAFCFVTFLWWYAQYHKMKWESFLKSCFVLHYSKIPCPLTKWVDTMRLFKQLSPFVLPKETPTMKNYHEKSQKLLRSTLPGSFWADKKFTDTHIACTNTCTYTRMYAAAASNDKELKCPWKREPPNILSFTCTMEYVQSFKRVKSAGIGGISETA